MYRLVPLLSLFVLLPACESEEARQISGAIATFIDFGMSNEERAKAPPIEPRTKRLNERSRKVVATARGGPTLEVVIDLPHELDSSAVEDVLTSELNRRLDQPYPKIHVFGRPAGLVEFGGLMGEARVQRRNQKGPTKTTLRSHVRDKAPPLTDAQYDALVELELTTARLGRGAKTKARAIVSERHGDAVVKEAIQRAHRRWKRR